MVVNNTVTKLIDIGFSEYEARAYMALVGTNPATAYEIARLSGIPSSKIYEVVARLEEKGVVSATEADKKKKHVPIAPEEFIESRRSMLDSTLNSLKDDLNKIGTENDVSYIWNIHDHDYLIDKASRMILSAKKTVLLSGWSDEISLFEDALKKKEEEGVLISTVHFGEAGIKTGQVFQHPIEDTIYEEKGGRGLVVIIDSKESLMGTVFSDKRVEGAWSMNMGFVTLAEDYIKHDVYIMKIVKRFDAKLKKHFGNNYEKLRDIFSDEELI